MAQLKGGTRVHGDFVADSTASVKDIVLTNTEISGGKGNYLYKDFTNHNIKSAPLIETKPESYSSTTQAAQTSFMCFFQGNGVLSIKTDFTTK